MKQHRRTLSPADALACLRVPGGLRLSPDGKHAVFVLRHVDGERDRTGHRLVLLHVGTGRTRELTDGSCDDTQPCWSPDGRSLFFVSNRQGPEEIWRLTLPGGAPERLTRLGGQIGAPQVDASGQRLGFLFEPPPGVTPALTGTAARIVHWSRSSPLADPLTGRPRDRFLCLLDLRTRRVRRLTAGKRTDQQFAWAPHGRALAFTSTRSTLAEDGIPQDELNVLDLRRGTSRLLVRHHGLELAPAWSPDGRHIAYIGHEAQRSDLENLHLWVVPLRGGSPQDLLQDRDLMCAPVSVTDTTLQADAEPQPPQWSADGSSIDFLASHRGCVQVYRVPATGGRVQQRTRGKHDIARFCRSRDGKVWVFLRRHPTSPGDVYVARPRHSGAARRPAPALALRRLTSLHAGLGRRFGWRAPQEFHVQAQPGAAKLHGFLWRAQHAPRRGPAVLVLHDGPAQMVGHSFVQEFQILAGAGYHVVCANLRGSAGYGTPFLQALQGTRGFEDLKDVHAVADWIASRPFVDPDRMAIMGEGYGGFLATWTIGHTPRFRCAVSTRGTVHFASYFGTSAAGAALRSEFLAPPWESHERYWRTSPLAFVGLLRTPLLLLHGDADGLCPASQSQEMFAALRMQERDVEMVQFCGEGHDLTRHGRPSSRSERWARILDWFERKL